MRFSVTAALIALVAGMLQPASAASWTLSFSTYFGGSGMTSATAIAVDGSGNIYVAGWTVSTTLTGCTPVRPYSGGVDAFVAKWDGATHRLDYCSFLGGSGDDRAFAIAVDGSGYAYVTGWTMSADFPVSGALQAALAGGQNAFVAKLNPAGVLVYSSYLGGSGFDRGNAIAVDSGGSVTVVGDTTSADFPLSNPIQSSLSGQTNVFITRLSPAGDSLVYSTYLGGSGSDHGAGVALDGTGAAYLTGGTTSMNFPVVSAFQPASGGNQDAFVAKIASTGSSLLYSTYLGGSGGTVGFPETGSAIAVDSDGNAYVTGTTSSPNFPLANALFSSSVGVGIHAYVSELNPTGSGLVFSTYLGGSSIDQAAAIAVDSGGNVVVAGFTASPDFPLADPTQASLAGSYDAFVTRLNSTGTALLESTFFGGSASDAANAVAYDAANAVYIAGQTQSLNLPVHNATQPALAGTQNAFLAVLTLATEVSAPPSPTGLAATAGSDQVTLSWVASGGASSYYVYRGTTAGGESTTAIAIGVTTASYIDTGLTNGTEYYYKVAAVNGGGASVLSGEASATPEPSAPGAPTGLTLTAGNASVALTWTAPGGATSYNVYRGTTAGGESTTPIATGVTNASYADSGLTNGTTYYYRVAAINGGGASALSGEASATPQVSAPPAPTALAATAGNAQVTLSWTAISSASSYSVYRGTTAGGESTTAIASGITTASYTDGGLTNGTTYYYEVAAVNAGGTSAMSGEASATPQVSRIVDAVLRDTGGSVRLSMYATSTLSNSGGQFASDPSAAQDLNGNTFVTARDNSNSIWANVYNPNLSTWSGWQSGGGIIQGVPSIAVDTSGTGWIASRDAYNSYWLVPYTTGSGFGSWTPLQGIFSTDPVVTACGDGSIYIIGKDNWNSLWSAHYIRGSGFQGWRFGGAIVTGKPAATCGGDNAVYIVAEDSWNSNWMARVSGNTWGNWYFGGAITSVTPRIAALGNGSEAVVILDSTNVVWTTTYTEGTADGWQPWEQVGGILQDVAPAGVGGELYFAGKSPTGDLWWWQQTGNQWTWIGNNGVAAGALAAAPR
jgi:fibronectin type 3 domain-containing protein